MIGRCAQVAFEIRDEERVPRSSSKRLARPLSEAARIRVPDPCLWLVPLYTGATRLQGYFVKLLVKVL